MLHQLLLLCRLSGGIRGRGIILRYRAWCHMIITCKPHGVNLIGASVLINKPQKVLNVCQTPPLCLGTRLYEERKSSGFLLVSNATWSAVILGSSSPFSDHLYSHQQTSQCKSTMDTNTEGCLSWKSLHNPTPYSGSVIHEIPELKNVYTLLHVATMYACMCVLTLTICGV